MGSPCCFLLYSLCPSELVDIMGNERRVHAGSAAGPDVRPRCVSILSTGRLYNMPDGRRLGCGPSDRADRPAASDGVGRSPDSDDGLRSRPIGVPGSSGLGCCAADQATRPDRVAATSGLGCRAVAAAAGGAVSALRLASETRRPVTSAVAAAAPGIARLSEAAAAAAAGAALRRRPAPRRLENGSPVRGCPVDGRSAGGRSRRGQTSLYSPSTASSSSEAAPSSAPAPSPSADDGPAAW